MVCVHLKLSNRKAGKPYLLSPATPQLWGLGRCRLCLDPAWFGSQPLGCRSSSVCYQSLRWDGPTALVCNMCFRKQDSAAVSVCRSVCWFLICIFVCKALQLSVCLSLSLSLTRSVCLSLSDILRICTCAPLTHTHTHSLSLSLSLSLLPLLLFSKLVLFKERIGTIISWRYHIGRMQSLCTYARHAQL